jgi:sulfatase modifying factor 1
VDVGEFWLSATTISWFDYARLMGWSPPPACFPPESECSGLDKMALFHLNEANKIRLQYCEDKTIHARDWHAHDPNMRVGNAPAEAVFGKPARESDDAYRYSLKPMVAVSWQEAAELCAKLSTPSVTYRLPTEVEWEKAARGGFVGKRYAWGNEQPTPDRCDFDRFDEFSIKASRALPPNAYGLHAMCGSVWEWTLDEYDALGYAGAPPPTQLPPPPEGRTGHAKGDQWLREHVLRGGSWADGAEACTVSFRMSRGSANWRDAIWGANLAPNIGFRVARVGPVP